MKWFLCLLVSLACATACVVEDKPVADGGTGGSGGMDGDAGNPCGCPDDKPVCLDDMITCVECTSEETGACDSSAPICDAQSNTCICSEDSDCTDRALAQCNSETRKCAPCNDNTQCDGVDGLEATNNICNSENVCVDCTPETEAESCAANRTCNPRTSECTGQAAGSLEVCESCVADSECGDDQTPSDDFRCVPMFYPDQETPFPATGDGFCLETFALGGCEQPYAIRIDERASLSDPTPTSYCGINEELATCPAVRALDRNETCPTGEDDDCPTSGLCRSVGGLAQRCTYRCSDETQCDKPGNPGSTCDSADMNDYCGG